MNVEFFAVGQSAKVIEPFFNSENYTTDNEDMSKGYSRTERILHLLVYKVT